jgi:hypothetical protein
MEMEYLAEKLGHKGKIAVFVGVKARRRPYCAPRGL